MDSSSEDGTMSDVELLSLPDLQVPIFVYNGDDINPFPSNQPVPDIVKHIRLQHVMRPGICFTGTDVMPAHFNFERFKTLLGEIIGTTIDFDKSMVVVEHPPAMDQSPHSPCFS